MTTLQLKELQFKLKIKILNKKIKDKKWDPSFHDFWTPPPAIPLLSI